MNKFDGLKSREVHWPYHHGLKTNIPSSDKVEEFVTYNLPVLKNDFVANGYVFIPNLLSTGCCDLISQSFFGNKHLLYKTNENNGTNRIASHNAPLSRFVHEILTPFVKTIIPNKCKPSYTFTSCYNGGSLLPMHVDSRPACTWNISIMIDSSDNSKVDTWPLILKTKNGIVKQSLRIGDAVIYPGTGMLHGREKMPSALDWVLGMFCHFAPFELEGTLD